jgi:glycosyltransferase involved in cell wall biosynthesis
LRVITVARDVPKKGLPFLRGVLRSRADRVRWDLVSDAAADFPGALGRARALPPGQVSAALAQAHVFALACRVDPSGDRDGVPVAAMEAMAAGLPVLIGDVAGTSELVDDTVGWLLPPEEEGAWRLALEEARDPAARARRGRAARARIASAWTLDHQVLALLEAWRSTDG